MNNFKGFLSVLYLITNCSRKVNINFDSHQKFEKMGYKIPVLGVDIDDGLTWNTRIWPGLLSAFTLLVDGSNFMYPAGKVHSFSYDSMR